MTVCRCVSLLSHLPLSLYTILFLIRQTVFVVCFMHTIVYLRLVITTTSNLGNSVLLQDFLFLFLHSFLRTFRPVFPLLFLSLAGFLCCCSVDVARSISDVMT